MNLYFSECFPSNFRLDSIFYHLDEFYIEPWNRMHPYLAGATVGYIMFRIKDRKFQKNRLVTISYWIFAIPIILATLFLTELKDSSNISFALALTFGRYLMGLFVGSIVIMCHLGYGTIFNKIFSSRFCVHINKTTYLIYLMHPAILLYFNSNQENSPHFDVPTIVSEIL